MLPLLTELNANGITHSILSAQHQTLLNDLTQYYNIQDYFIEIIGLNNHYAHSKVETGIEWISRLNLNPQKVLMIGDTDHDFEVAQSLGTDCLLISHGHHCHSRLVQTGAPVIHELKNILHIFGIDLNSAEKCRN